MSVPLEQYIIELEVEGQRQVQEGFKAIEGQSKETFKAIESGAAQAQKAIEGFASSIGFPKGFYGRRQWPHVDPSLLGGFNPARIIAPPVGFTGGASGFRGSGAGRGGFGGGNGGAGGGPRLIGPGDDWTHIFHFTPSPIKTPPMDWLKILSAIYILDRVLTRLIGIFESAVQRTEEFVKQVLNIHQLGGGTLGQAAGFATLFRVAGVTDQAALRDIIKIMNSPFNKQQAAGLNMFGITPRMGESALSLFDRLADHLGNVTNVTKRTHAEFLIFGSRMDIANQALVRMTKTQRQQAISLGQMFDPKILGIVQNFMIDVSLLGETIMQRLVYPLMGSLLPVLDDVATSIMHVTNFLGWLNDETGGIFLMVAAFTALGTALGAATMALEALGIAFTVAGLKALFFDAATGQWTALAKGIAVGAAVGVGLGIINDQRNSIAHLEGKDKQADIADNTAKTNDILEDIRGHLIGAGPRGARAVSLIEANYAIARALAMDMG